MATHVKNDVEQLYTCALNSNGMEGTIEEQVQVLHLQKII
jgi:hypothetical protein